MFHFKNLDHQVMGKSDMEELHSSNSSLQLYSLRENKVYVSEMYSTMNSTTAKLKSASFCRKS